MDTLQITKLWWLWLMSGFTYFFIFLHLGEAVERFVMRRKGTATSLNYITEIFNGMFFKKFRIKLRFYYRRYLRREWFRYQIKYKSIFKTKLVNFLKIMSFFLILYKILLWILILFFAYIFVFLYFTSLLLYIEHYFLFFILIIFLKFVFFYNFFVSIFFKRTVSYWLFFFYSFEPDEMIIDQFKLHSDSQVLMPYYPGLEEATFENNNVYACATYLGKKKYKEHFEMNWKDIFSKNNRSSRFELPPSWNKKKNKFLDPMAQTYYFKIWLKFMKYASLLINLWHSYCYFEDIILRDRKIFNSYFDELNSYEFNTNFDKNLKKFKFK